ncbi:MAG: tRNA (guanosine(37)-N1)-methyltransferase TrmD [Armatimonadota bacterium]|nr:tRNA (guanosine(37)-N1)-methyltransferase TrmD [Armatimonadota bacterium]
MRISFVSLFPATVLAAVRHSMLLRAEQAGIVSFNAVNVRDFATDPHRTVDDTAYGGGPGMVMKPDVVGAAIDSMQPEGAAVILTDPSGKLFRQADAAALSNEARLIFVCGHYEGIDDRVAERYSMRRYSIGDFVLTGGELPAAAMADAVVRLLPGVLGSPESLQEDAFQDGLLSYPQYTKPSEWEGMAVPDVLLSGDHDRVDKWRRARRLELTRQNRPDLFARAPLSKDDLKLLQ